VKLALPKELPLEHASSRYEIAPLRAWFANAAHEIASQFDRRNGNTHWTDELGSASDVLELEPPPR